MVNAADIFSDTAAVVWSQKGTKKGGTETTLLLEDPKMEEYVWGSGKVQIKGAYTFFGGLREVR